MIRLAFDEDYVWLGCIACREDVNATQGFAVPVRMYVAALECPECGEVIATYDILTREAALKTRKKTVYAIRTRWTDDEPWSPPTFYKRRNSRDKDGATARIIVGVRTHSYEEKFTEEQITEMEFADEF